MHVASQGSPKETHEQIHVAMNKKISKLNHPLPPESKRYAHLHRF